MESNPELSDSNSAISIPKGGSGRSSPRSTNTDVESTTLTGMTGCVPTLEKQSDSLISESSSASSIPKRSSQRHTKTDEDSTILAEKEFDSQINESSSGSSVSKRDSRGSSQRSIKTEEENATLAGITFSGTEAKVINLERSGHKIFALIIKSSHVDKVYHDNFPSIRLEILKLTDGRKTTISQALKSAQSSDVDLAFTSSTVKNGDLFGVESILGIGSIYNIIKYTDNESLYELAKSEERRQVDFALSLPRDKEIFSHIWTYYYYGYVPFVLYPSSTSHHEHVDKGKFIQATMAFSERPALIIEEAMINQNEKKLPHGNVDFLVTSTNNAMDDVVLVNKEGQSLVIIGSVKSPSTIGTIETERQVVLELLTLAECCKGQRTFTVLILADRSKLQIYLYYPKKDILMRTTPTVPYVGEHGIVGCLLMFLILRHHRLLACERMDDVASISSTNVTCGWADAVKEVNFSQVVKIQKVPKSEGRKSKSKSSSCADTDGIEQMLMSKRLKFIEEL